VALDRLGRSCAGIAAAATVAGGTAFLDSALAVAFAGAILAATASTGARTRSAPCCARSAALYGRISYGLYMTHIAVFIYLGNLDLRMNHYGVAGSLALVAIRLAVCTAVAAALWLWLRVSHP